MPQNKDFGERCVCTHIYYWRVLLEDDVFVGSLNSRSRILVLHHTAQKYSATRGVKG